MSTFLLFQNAMGYYDSSKVDFNFFDLSGRSFDYLVYGAGAVEVEVDCHTGDISVLSAHLVMDVGRSLNPAIDVGQVSLEKNIFFSWIFLNRKLYGLT